MHSNSHDIQQKHVDGVPMSAWLSHNKQFIKTKTHKFHNPYHNSFLDYFPMSYKLHKTSNKYFEGLKCSTQAIHFGVVIKYHI